MMNTTHERLRTLIEVRDHMKDDIVYKTGDTKRYIENFVDFLNIWIKDVECDLDTEINDMQRTMQNSGVEV